ncbi:unnamed protein product, partial [Tilletia caries]
TLIHTPFCYLFLLSSSSRCLQSPPSGLIKSVATRHTRSLPLLTIGTSSNPYTVLDSEDDADFPTGPNPSNDDLFTVSDHEMEEAVTDASTFALAEAVEEAIEGGANGDPPDYTEPSYRQRLDDTLGAFSVMPADRRRVWFQYFRRFLTPEIAQEVETRTCNLRARNDTLTSDTVVLRRLLAIVGDGSTRLNMDPRSQWTKTKFRKSDFKEMPPRKIR